MTAAKWAYNTRYRGPFGNGRFDLTVSPAIKAGQLVVPSGDSVTAGALNPLGIPDPTYAWTVPFEASVNAAFVGAGKTPPTFTTYATGGWTTADWLAGIDGLIALKPDHIILFIGVNDFLGHGTPIPPATSGDNVAAGVNKILIRLPSCRIHVGSNMWGSTEHSPEGSNADDAPIMATNAGILAKLPVSPLVIWYPIRTPIFDIDEPIQNPANVATGQLIQNGGGFHTTKTANPPATMSGQQVMSARMFSLIPLDFS